MTIEFDTTIPSIRQVQSLIKQAQGIELKLVTGDILFGKIVWQDQHCLCLLDEDNQQTLVWRQAIAYLKLKVSASESRSLSSV